MNAVEKPSVPGLSTLIESALRTAMVDVLALESVKEDENFFCLGGNSLAMVEIISRTQHALSVQFDPNPVIDTFFGAGTLRALIDRIEALVIDSRAMRAEHGN